MIISIVIGALSYFDPNLETAQFGRQFRLLQGGILCVVVATSLIATFLIGAQIYLSTSINPRARQRYQHVLEIAIQSSGLYTSSLLLEAVMTLIINTNHNFEVSTAVINAYFYATSIASITPVCL